MTLHISKGEPGVSCVQCKRTDLPNVFILHEGNLDEPDSLCIDCLAGAIELVTKWHVRKTINTWYQLSYVKNDFQSLDLSTRRARKTAKR